MPLTQSRCARINLSPEETRISDRFYELTTTPLLDPKNKLRGKLLVLHEFTQQKKATETEREAREMAEALYAAGVALNSTLDFEQVLDLMFEQIERVVPYDAGYYLSGG